ncbi:MAG: XRE family transcriptional regulator [Microscillaceae bacterium]|nr:XRE family transcriptional regulator [Microscillaceae bacterium]MDW8461146.1 XRE family transcriptional regulator [Cytophagales bacterium]
MDTNKELIFGLKIKQLRLEKGYSLQELAQKTGIAVSYLNEIEKAKKYPRPDKIKLLAQALDVSVQELTSPQLSENLKPIEILINSHLFTEQSLEIFGLAKIGIVSLFSDKPSKANAFIRTLLELARNYDLSRERFYMAILRSYQEMHENYFEEIEVQAQAFRQKYHIGQEQSVDKLYLQKILEENYHYKVDFLNLHQYPDLQTLRTVMQPKQKASQKNILWLNPKLSETQQIFALAREIGYNFLQLKERVYTSTWVRANSFEELLHNYQASYFAGALLIPALQLKADLAHLFQQDFWSEEIFLAIMRKYKASPEMFLHRFISIITHYFNIKKLFFLRFTHQRNTQNFILDKELHLSDLHNPHATNLHEHYCRRWISLDILRQLEQRQTMGQNEIMCKTQISQYYDSPNEYFCISIARNLPNASEINTSVTIGLLINEDLKKIIRFVEDKKVLKRQVGVSCEKCAAINCQERAAEAIYVHQRLKNEKILQSLEKLQKQTLSQS